MSGPLSVRAGPVVSAHRVPTSAQRGSWRIQTCRFPLQSRSCSAATRLGLSVYRSSAFESRSFAGFHAIVDSGLYDCSVDLQPMLSTSRRAPAGGTKHAPILWNASSPPERPGRSASVHPGRFHGFPSALDEAPVVQILEDQHRRPRVCRDGCNTLERFVATSRPETGWRSLRRGDGLDRGVVCHLAGS